MCTGRFYSVFSSASWKSFFTLSGLNKKTEHAEKVFRLLPFSGLLISIVGSAADKPWASRPVSHRCQTGVRAFFVLIVFCCCFQFCTRKQVSAPAPSMDGTAKQKTLNQRPQNAENNESFLAFSVCQEPTIENAKNNTQGVF